MNLMSLVRVQPRGFLHEVIQCPPIDLGKRANCTFNEKGKTRSDLFKEHVVLTDQAGGCVPAVPAQDGGYWGCTSVPDDACAWWDNLPTYPTA